MLIKEAIGQERVYVLQSEVDVLGVFATKSLARQYVRDNRVYNYTIQEFELQFDLPGQR